MIEILDAVLTDGFADCAIPAYWRWPRSVTDRRRSARGTGGEPGDMTSYFRSCEEDLKRTLAAPVVPAHLAEAVADLELPRVLDIGCGIGQSLFVLAARCGASGIGLDVSQQAVNMGRAFQSRYLPHTEVDFIQGRAESLPFPGASFDVVLCRLALPYVDNPKSLAEIARVLKPRGVVVLRIHHLRYYLHQFRRGLFSFQFLSLVHALRVLIGGLVYHVTGRQPRLRGLNETFQTRWQLAKDLAKSGLTVVRELPDSTPNAPDFLIHKAEGPSS